MVWGISLYVWCFDKKERGVYISVTGVVAIKKRGGISICVAWWSGYDRVWSGYDRVWSGYDRGVVRVLVMAGIFTGLST